MIASVVSKSSTICGRADRYISVDNGPNMLSNNIRMSSGPFFMIV